MFKDASSLTTSFSGLNELKQRLLFVLVGIFIYRIGAHIPVPGLDPQRLAHFFAQQQSTIVGMFNMFSGGALSRFSVFAIGIMPYISASIIVQLFTVVSPTLEQLKKEGEQGQRKINQYTRYGTLLLAVVQAVGMLKWLSSYSIAFESTFVFYFAATVTLVTGTMFLMWLGEQMTERGVGNGISLIIFAGIVSRLPASIGEVLEQVREGQMQGLTMLLLLAVILVVTGVVVFVERAQRRITVNYAQRTVGKKIYAAQSSHLPLKINISGVIPPIFASAMILLPVTLATWFGNGKGFTWLGDLGLALSPGQPLYMVVYSLMIIFFAFTYTALVFNPKDTAENLKKSNAFVPGIRPGDQTAKYIDAVMTRLTFAGSIYLVLVCLLPQILMSAWHVSFYFGGTSLLIIVVVLMDFMAQIQAHLMSHQYESLMKKANIKGNRAGGMNLLR